MCNTLDHSAIAAAKISLGNMTTSFIFQLNNESANAAEMQVQWSKAFFKSGFGNIFR